MPQSSEKKMSEKRRVLVDRRRLWMAAIGIVVCGLTGGSTRIDIPALIVTRPLLIMLGATMLSSAAGWDARRFRLPALMLFGFALTMAIQLIPLPPGMWLALPGHSTFAREAAALGYAQPWRPIALAPDLVWNSIFALVPVAFILMALAGIPLGQWRWLLLTTVGLAIFSALLGVIQIAAGPASAAYLYTATSHDLPVGLFANRNHQAVFLAASLPLIAACISACTGSFPQQRLPALWLGSTTVLFLFVMVFVTGSRAGTALAIVGAIGFFLLLPVRPTKKGRYGRALYLAAVLVAVGLVAMLVILLGRATSIDRALEARDLADLRFRTLPVLLHITLDFFPFGIGWGAFDPVFRLYEPDALLKPTYFNHAHNDLLEVLLTGGLPSLAVVLTFLVWWVAKVIAVWHRPDGNSDVSARAGSIASAILLAACLVDYPLRTPLLAMVFTLACCWMTRSAEPKSNGRALQQDCL